MQGRPVGSVEDFCPLHRKIHAFELFAVTQHWNIYQVAIGKSTLLHHVTRGHTHGCGHITVVDALEFERDTPPARHSERLAIEIRLARNVNSLTSKERRYLLSEQITAISKALKHGLSNEADSAAQKRPMGITVGIFIASMILWGVAGSPLFALPFVGALMAFPFAFIRPRQKLQKLHEAEVLDAVLSCGLPPLNVTHDEMCEAFKWGKSQGFNISRKFRNALLDGLSSAPVLALDDADDAAAFGLT